jgi:hypothetical protein
MIGFLYNSLFYNDCKETSVTFRLLTNPKRSLKFFRENIPADFRNPLPFRRLPAKPHQSERLPDLG